MSRVSSKSSLSPSATSGSSAIDLGKDSGVNLGEKTQTSVSSGGIGVTREVANFGGLSVTGGIGVDISPINLGISGNPNYEDPSKSTVSIAGGAEIPGGILGVSGGVTINTSTGKVEGASIGGEVAGVGINISKSDEGVGLELSLQIPFTPIEINLGFEFPNDKKKPTPNENDNKLDPNWTPWKPIPGGGWETENTKPGSAGKGSNGLPNSQEWPKRPSFPKGEPCGYNLYGLWQVLDLQTGKLNQAGSALSQPIVEHRSASVFPNGYSFSSVIYESFVFGNITYIGAYSAVAKSMGTTDRFYYGMWNPNYTKLEIVFVKFWYADFYLCLPSFPPTSSGSPPPQIPFPNPPPRKQMDECCRDSIKLLREIKRFEQETMLLLGRPLNSKGNLIPLPVNAKYFGEEIERIKTPIENIKEPEKEKIKFNNFYELQMYLLQQQINLDVGVDPQSFVAPSGTVQNPDYERDSEQSLESSSQPETDKLGNKRELELGKDIKINSLSQQHQYLFDALKRLEYLFPYGELADAKFDKSLIIPGATGEVKVHNLIHFQEFFAQYLNATLGDPKIPIKVEDNNALKAGKQAATFHHFSIAQMIRELYRVTLESGDDINAIMETGIRDLRTNLANRIQIVQAVEMLQALVEDTGMLESQYFIPLKLEGDPYAGKWKAGMGFEPGDKRENSDIRDLLIQIAEMFIRSTSIPATKEGVEKALAAAKFKTQVDMALTRSQVKRAAAASRARTKKRRK